MKKLQLRGMLARSFVDLGVFSAVINMLTLVMPLYMLQVYDRIVPSGSMETLAYISIIALVAVLVLGVLEAVRATYANRVATRLDTEMGPHAFTAAMTGPRAVLGDVQPLRDLALLRGFIGSRALFVLFDLPFSPLFILLLYFIHPVVCLATIVGALLMIGLAVANRAGSRQASIRASESLSASMNTAQGFARNFEVVRTLGMATNASEHWGTRFASSLAATDRLTAINAIYGSATRGVRLLMQISIYGLGGYLTLKGEMTAGMIFASSMVAARAVQPLDLIVASWRQIIEANAAWKRLSAGLEAEAQARQQRLQLPAPKGEVSVEQLVYFPPEAKIGSEPLIKRIGFSVPAGHTLAIIGPSQAGKSTLARLLVGASEPRSGTVRIDGGDIAQWDRDFLGRHVGYLPQEVEFFAGTIMQNVARFDLEAASGDVIAAAEAANAHDVILRQRDGYETVIGPAGARLSGGEKQRIGLARAFYGKPSLIVLDEPDAHLDSDGVAALEKAVDTAKARGATVIVITHRRAVAARADRILMLRDGQIEKVGTPSEVFGASIEPGATPARPASVVSINQPHSIQVR